MKVYLMLPFGTIEPIWHAEPRDYEFCCGNLTPDYAIFFEAPYKYKFQKALIDSDNYKDAHLVDIQENWTYTAVDPETFSSC